jgi:hypothetical protein
LTDIEGCEFGQWKQREENTVRNDTIFEDMEDDESLHMLLSMKDENFPDFQGVTLNNILSMNDIPHPMKLGSENESM